MNRVAALVLTAARLIAAGILFAICASHWWTTSARARFEALPEYDFKAAAGVQRAAGHYGDALMIIDAGLDTLPGEEQAELLALKTQVVSERDGALRRLGDAGSAVLPAAPLASGPAGVLNPDDDAVAVTRVDQPLVDLLVIGDVRDIVARGGLRKMAVDDSDRVLLALSTLRSEESLPPDVDTGLIVLALAHATGALSDSLAHSLVTTATRAAGTGNDAALRAFASDASRLTYAARPAAAIQILRLVDDSETLHVVADFAERPGGAFALWLGGQRSLDWLAATGPKGQEWLLRAAHRGEAGLDLLTRRGRLLLRPHPLLGVLRKVYGGNVPEPLLELLDSQADALFGIATGGLLFELTLLRARIRNFRRRRTRRRDAVIRDMKV